MTTILKKRLSLAFFAYFMMGQAFAEPDPLVTEAIKLTRIQGEVLVNVLGKYQITTIDTVINSNTKILVRQESRAELHFPNGCIMNLKGGKIYQAGTESECKQGVTRVVADNEANVATNKPNPPSQPQVANQSPNYLMLGGISALVIGAAALAGNNSQNSNASP